jgi:DNA polymerase-3 subunit epsilon
VSGRRSFALWLGALYGAALLVLLCAAALLRVGLPEGDAAALQSVLERRSGALALGALLLLFACAGLVRWFFVAYVKPPRAMAEQTRVIRSANAELRVAATASGLAELAAAINELAGAYQAAQRENEARAADARARLEEERNRLAALMSELAQGVLVCSAEGIILLYNEQARALFASPDAAAAQAPVGLGRSVFALLERGQIAHAAHKLERSLARGEHLPSARFVASTRARRLLKVQAAPFLDAESRLAGMVLTLDDVTGILSRETQRRSLLQALAGRIRAPAANIRAAAENLAAFPEIDEQRRTQFIGIVAAESQALSATIDDALREHTDALKAALALEDLRAADLLEFARSRMGEEVAIVVEGDPWVRVDSYALVQGLVHVAERLRAAHAVEALQLRAHEAGPHCELDLSWQGAAVPSEALVLWESEPMEAGGELSALSLREVLEQHGGELWLANARCVRFLLPRADAAASAPGPARLAESRPEYYDFDLFGRGVLTDAPNDAPLATLSYTVFDTETTGLEPSAGDEIISIGAVRIVNGRLLRNETFEQLVNPRRPLNPASARVHRIDPAALGGQPSIDAVLPAFHRFCEQTILVGHNAAFDMRFFELKQNAAGVRFGQPVLDTLLLSAVAHPALEDHRLEAIAARMGVDVIGRHTALGDAILAAEIFLKLLPLLGERGVLTLGQALEASRQTYYARLQY